MKAHPRGKRLQLRLFECPVCGERKICPKGRGRTSQGHIKHTWCVRCKAVTPHVQIE